MAYTVFTAPDVGDPIIKEYFDTISGNFTDHETRINNFEAGSIKIPIFKGIIRLSGITTTATGIDYFVADQNMSVTSAVIRMFVKGSLTGTLEIDIKKSSTDLANGSFTSIFTTKPSLVMASASNYDSSTNQVIGAGGTLTAGEVLRLDITSLPATAVMPYFLINVYGEI